jgi:hypothetical protein
LIVRDVTLNAFVLLGFEALCKSSSMAYHRRPDVITREVPCPIVQSEM